MTAMARLLADRAEGPYLIDGVDPETAEETAERAAEYAVAERACPSLAAFGFRLWGQMPEVERPALRPYLERLSGSRAGLAVATRRTYLGLDFAFRMAVPAALRLNGLELAADRAAAFTPISSRRSLAAAKEGLEAIEENDFRESDDEENDLESLMCSGNALDGAEYVLKWMNRSRGSSYAASTAYWGSGSCYLPLRSPGNGLWPGAVACLDRMFAVVPVRPPGPTGTAV